LSKIETIKASSTIAKSTTGNKSPKNSTNLTSTNKKYTATPSSAGNTGLATLVHNSKKVLGNFMKMSGSSSLSSPIMGSKNGPKYQSSLRGELRMHLKIVTR
jgi:hypothetical protein